MARKKVAITAFEGYYRFLSNFYAAPVTFEYEQYPTAEHAYQAAKTLELGERRWIKQARTPGQAKRRGRQVEIQARWDDIRIAAMEEILRSKFENPTLRKRLLATHPRHLIEGNDWGDRFWGAEARAGIWYGENRLGLLLVKLREEFVREESDK